jgi:hypothetical protein
MSETTMEGERLRFRQPPNDPLPEDTTIGGEDETTSPSDPSRPEGVDQPSAPASSTTSASPTEPPSRADVAAVFAGAILIGTALISWGLKVRRKRLRQPNQRERMAIATPVARIFQRRVDIAMAGPILRDIADGCEAAAATMAYLETEPIQSAVQAPAPAPPAEPEPEPDVIAEYAALHGFEAS